RQRRRLSAVATAVVLLTVAAGSLWTTRPSRSLPVTARAIVHSPAQEVLADGTIVELEAGARITVNLSPESRRIELRGGGAHFQVAHDPNRPLVVTAGQLEVRAVGTGF